MGRREFITLLGSAALATPHSAYAQQSSAMPRVGYLFSFAPAEGPHLWEACRQGLHELGYVEGRTIALEPRWADGQYARLPDLAAELVRSKVNVIVAAATPASLAAKAATATIPIVIVAVSDPTRLGLAASLARPGGNITGISLLTPELSGKRLQLLSDIVPRLSSVAVLQNPDNLSHRVFLDETILAGKEMNVRIQSISARNSGEIDKAFEATLNLGTQGLIVFDDPVLWGHRKSIVKRATETRLPVMYGYSEFVTEGGLISYGPYRPDLYRRTASYVGKILKGAKPAELPIERPVKFELKVNAKSAKALGLGIPQSIILRADEVIE